MMFSKKDEKNLNSDLITSLKNRICELEEQLNLVANDNGSVIIKQLPNGQIELNGIQIDNTSAVDYYNSSQATYGELTMFRIGKETKQREMDKLISRHMDEIDAYNAKISSLQSDIVTLEDKSKLDNDTISMYEKSENHLKHEIDKKYKEIDELIKSHECEKQEIIDRYEGMINGLEEDIECWKKRYLKINNVTLDGTIITKYGKLLGDQQ